MFETTDGKAIYAGYFVKLEKNKVRKATVQDEYILGITSAKPAILPNGGELRWKNKYMTTEWDSSMQYIPRSLRPEWGGSWFNRTTISTG
jgi:Peptidase_G2, IMC autoproteolytic cleavage domain